MSTENHTIALSMTMLQSALVALDDIGEKEAALKVQHAISILEREPVPKTVAEVDEALAAILSKGVSEQDSCTSRLGRFVATRSGDRNDRRADQP